LEEQLHCPYGNKWSARTQKTRKNLKGVLVERKTLTGIYYCRQNHKDFVLSDCPRHISAKKAGEEACEKICGAVDKPECPLSQARNLVEQLRANVANLHEERDRIEKELERINLEDLQAGVAELKDASPQNEEERHNLFLLKKQIVDTLVEWVIISKSSKIKVEIHRDLFAILDQDAGLENLSPATYFKRGGIYTRIHDICRTRQLFVQI